MIMLQHPHLSVLVPYSQIYSHGLWQRRLGRLHWRVLSFRFCFQSKQLPGTERVSPFYQCRQLITHGLQGLLLLFVCSWAASCCLGCFSILHHPVQSSCRNVCNSSQCFPVSVEVANQTNIIFQNATLGGKELNPVVLTQPKKKKRKDKIMFADLTVLSHT